MADVLDGPSGWTKAFSESEWFERGWTLQELIAPSLVEFYAKDWTPIGTKLQRCDEIAARTLVQSKVLLDPSVFATESTAHRMSWAAHRKVTREEDQAYSLLGLFQVSMPMLYGEGRAKAFGRLQEAIYHMTRDDSLFLFRYSPFFKSLPLLPESPTNFCQRERCSSCRSTSVECLPPEMRYEHITASETWPIMAHEQLLTTFTPMRFEGSTKLLLIKIVDIPKNLLDFDECPSLRRASHLAVLRPTTEIGRAHV